jgi:PilZ domain
VNNRSEHRISTALSVIVHGTDSYGKSFSEPAGAVDTSHTGTRLCGLKVPIAIGSRIEIENDGCRTPYIVQWIGAEHTLQDGQIGARSLELNDRGDPTPLDAYQHEEFPETVKLKPGSEQRRFPRKICRLAATVKAEDKSIQLQGTVTDISLDGCYIEMLTPLPSGTFIHVSIVLDESRITAMGVVRYSQTGLGMGVEFMAMSPECFEQLRNFAFRGSQVPAVREPILPSSTSFDVKNGGTNETSTAIVTTGVLAESSCHVPTVAEALEVLIRVLSRKGVVTREELSAELCILKQAKT